MSRLGSMYRKRQIMQKDYDRALQLYEKARMVIDKNNPD